MILLPSGFERAPGSWLYRRTCFKHCPAGHNRTPRMAWSTTQRSELTLHRGVSIGSPTVKISLQTYPQGLYEAHRDLHRRLRSSLRRYEQSRAENMPYTSRSAFFADDCSLPVPSFLFSNVLRSFTSSQLSSDRCNVMTGRYVLDAGNSSSRS